jgi:N-hydroxyarylamine O-acetyltransferase
MLHVAAYLDRISCNGPVEPNAEVLRNLHRVHMFNVPFENLDIALGRKIICNEEAILRKIVELKRGGFCYELNGAFAALLRELGFKVTLLSARVARQGGSYGPEFDHLTLRVDLDEPWLADVGFGDSFLEPLRLKLNIGQPQGTRKFRLVEEQGALHMEMAENDAEWRRQYSFTLIPRQLGDFAGMCHYHQTSPQSSFTQKSICSRATPEGRITLADRKLIISRDGKREESLLTGQEWQVALKKYFEIVL